MSHVEIDDFDCPNCKKLTIADLNIKNCIYTCLKCGKEFGGKIEEKVKEAIERNLETDNQEIGRLISEGNTSGILDNEAGYRIFWDLKVDKFQNN